MKKYFSIAMLLATALLASCSNEEDSTKGGDDGSTIAVTGVTLSKPASNSIEIGESITLTATVAPENATNKKVTWSASPEGVVTIDNGVVTGEKAGMVTITVTTEDNSKTDVYSMEVKAAAVVYAVGDLYPDATNPIGVVFWLDEDSNGAKGKIVSLTQSKKIAWDTTTPQQDAIATTATNENDGALNMEVIKALDSWENKYAPFKWCNDQGEGWYLPAINELTTLYNAKDKVNSAIKTANGTTLGTDYWSSTEDGKTTVCILFAGAKSGDWAKLKSFYTRAINVF